MTTYSVGDIYPIVKWEFEQSKKKSGNFRSFLRRQISPGTLPVFITVIVCVKFTASVSPKVVRAVIFIDMVGVVGVGRFGGGGGFGRGRSGRIPGLLLLTGEFIQPPLCFFAKLAEGETVT